MFFFSGRSDVLLEEEEEEEEEGGGFATEALLEERVSKLFLGTSEGTPTFEEGLLELEEEVDTLLEEVFSWGFEGLEETEGEA